MPKLLLSTLESVPGYSISKHLGLVQGSSVRAKHVGRDLMAGLKNMVGGELVGYTELLQETRDEAIERMQREAEAIGANAVLNVRMATSSVTAGAAEVFAYGSAVLLAPSVSTAG
ncbi:MAG: YbjQ family protein [Ottowia sp.]|nr:YbjQ family protein [Ottowia sp.]